MDSENVMKVGDLISFTVLIGVLTSALPVLAALLTVVWTSLRIYEMDTVQCWLKGRKCYEAGK